MPEPMVSSAAQAALTTALLDPHGYAPHGYAGAAVLIVTWAHREDTVRDLLGLLPDVMLAEQLAGGRRIWVGTLPCGLRLRIVTDLDVEPPAGGGGSGAC